MNRLTRKVPGGYGTVEGYELNTLQGARAVTNKLAEYENTGLEPSEINEIIADIEKMLTFPRFVETMTHSGDKGLEVQQ